MPGIIAADLARRSFALIFADEFVEDLVDRAYYIRSLGASHIIICRTEPEDLYYLIEIERVLTELEQKEAVLTVAEALELENLVSIPLIGADEPVDFFEESCIVYNNATIPGTIVGFYDKTQIPGRKTRGTATSISGDKGRIYDRSVVAEFPENVKLNEIPTLKTYISIFKSGLAIPVEIPAGGEIEVLVIPKQGFELLGESLQSITLTRENNSEKKEFKLKAISEGLGRIQIIAYHLGEQLGILNIVARIQGKETTEHEEHRKKLEVSDVTIGQPDLKMEIHETRRSDGHLISFYVSEKGSKIEGLGHKHINVGLQQYASDLFGMFDNLPLNNYDEAKISIEETGRYLFEQLFPERLQSFLWEKRRQISTIQLVSDEPWIPWELCRLAGWENGEPRHGQFFCETFALARWFKDVSRVQALAFNELGSIIPKAGLFSPDRLPGARQEQGFIEELRNHGINVSIIDAKKISVLKALNSGNFNCFHFAGHGSYSPDPNRARIYLEKSDLRPEETVGQFTKFGQGKPFVFLNSCHGGKIGQSLTGIGGWARRFVESGAAGFVGAYWSVYDKAALIFAKALYSQLLAGTEIGEAARLARNTAKNDADPLSWLAYTVYANPLAKINIQ